MEDGTFRFCGQQTACGTSWCDHHLKRVHGGAS
jgi:hypothetical protein